MKKLLCSLGAVLLALCAIFACCAEEDIPAAIDVPQVEILQLDEGSVTVREVNPAASAPNAATPAPTSEPEPAEESEPEAEPEASAAPEAESTQAPQAEPTATDAPQPTLRPLSAPSRTAAPGKVMLGFEDGFALELPEGWRCHPVTEEMAAKGVVYCLSDAAGAGWLYVQSWNTDCANISEVKALIDRTADIQTSGVYDFNGSDFVVYDLTEVDVSCCAALLDGRVMNLVFTPQSDGDFMAVAAEILNTFEIL